MGINCFSIGSYINPNSPHDPKRPSIKGDVNDQLLSMAIQSSQENLHQGMVDWADVVIVMHRADWIHSNWTKFKGKKVIWRTIGQSTPDIENQMVIPKMNGVKIVRYSPGERGIQQYIGEDAMIRFYADPEEFTGYTGEIPAVLTIGQSMKQRAAFCGYDIFQRATEGLERSIYGTPSLNPDLSPMDDPLWKGQLTYEDLKRAYRTHRAYFYTGTYPASYVLNFMEAFMTGIPVVAIGKELADLKYFKMDSYEVPSIIENGVNGFVSNDIEELKRNVDFLLKNPEEAKKIGQKGREKAIELFGKATIKAQWQSFFESL